MTKKITNLNKDLGAMKASKKDIKRREQSLSIAFLMTEPQLALSLQLDNLILTYGINSVLEMVREVAHKHGKDAA